MHAEVLFPESKRTCRRTVESRFSPSLVQRARCPFAGLPTLPSAERPTEATIWSSLAVRLGVGSDHRGRRMTIALRVVAFAFVPQTLKGADPHGVIALSGMASLRRRPAA